MFSCLFGSRCVELKALLRMNIIYRPSFWTVLLTQKLRGTSGISTELKFKRGEAKTMGRGEGEEKREDWRNLMNIPSGSERGTTGIKACLQRTAQRNDFKSCRNPRGSAARLNMPPGQCMKGLESRLRVCERVLSACLISHWGKSSYINLAEKRQTWEHNCLGESVTKTVK